MNLCDYNNNNNIAIALLVEGEYFGEISILYNCPRTCTVVSRNYNSMATFSESSFRELRSDYPLYAGLMLQ